ncbi:MAG: TRAP transporter substrate-binding protein [Proteobacteria bacterium]|nr:TRAP transporter substrate-binding protein [Pseudomonadota bacterium]MBU1713079.1 TRAP transporter substrate-binding protein [Pseudomonadota bacterium]
MDKKVFFVWVFLFILAITGGALTAGDPAFAADTYHIKFNYDGPKSPPSMHPLSQAIGMFGKKLEENSGGRFKVDIYWGGSLYKDDNTQYSALRSNVIQMCEVSGGRMGGEIPETFLMEFPFVFDSMEHVYRFFDKEGKNLFEPLYLKKGYKLIGFWPYGFQNFVSSKGFLAKKEDFKGVKLRIRPSKIVAAQMENLGASAQVIPYMETYNALQLKVVDGAECPLSVIQAVKWHETGDYITISRHSLLFAAMLVNPKFYDSLPADLRKIFDDTFKEVTEVEHKIQEEVEYKMPWIMMSERPSLQFKWLTEKERSGLKEIVKPVWNTFGKDISKEFYDAIEKSR